MEALQDLKSRMEQERPTPWEEVPDIALYMDQLISYMPRQLIRFVPRAEGKRYGPIHLGYLTAVVALKQILSVRDIGALLSAGRETGKTPPELYRYFCIALDRALTDTAQAIDPEATEQDLAALALDLALRSYANQLACARILDILQPQEGKVKRKKEG